MDKVCNCECVTLTGELDLGYRGDDGLTPYIGENGNWWIGDTDTGKPSRGEAFRYEDYTEEQLESLRGPEGQSGGFLYPTMDYDPVEGTIVVRGLKAEVRRITFDEENNELVITI